MAQTGILEPDARVELIDGDIVEMSPTGRRHNARVDRCNRLFHQSLGDTAIIRVQGSIVLDDNGEPEPDLVLLRPRDDFYDDADATPADVLLIVEVADSSETYDRMTKAPLYARHGILELWIANLNRDQVIVYRDPASTGYATTRVFRRGESLTPLAFPNLTIAIDDILG